MSARSNFSHDLKPISRADILFFVGIFLFLYTQLFQLPFTPYYFDGDQMISLSNATRLVEGEIMYGDFFHLTPPGAEVVYAALFAIFGVKVWILNFVILVLGFFLAFLTWSISRHVLSGIFVYLPSSLLMVIGFRTFFIDGSYRLFSIVFVLAAIAVLMKDRKPRPLMLAGGLCGMASFFVQPRGALALGGILMFIAWESFRDRFDLKEISGNAALLIGSFLIVVAATNVYFLSQAGFDNYYFSLVTFVRENYKHDPLSNSAAFFTDITQLGMYFDLLPPLAAASRYFRMAAPLLFFYLIPLAYLIFLFARFRHREMASSRDSESKLMLFCFVGIALIAGISAPSGFRFAHVSMPGLVVLIWLVQRVRYSRPAAITLLAALGLIGVSYAIQRQSIEKYYLDLPAGRSAFFYKPAFEKYRWIGQQTQPGEIFYEPYHPGFYFPFHLINPTPMYLIRDSDYSPRFQIDSVMRALEKNPPQLIVWPRKWSKKPEERAADDYLEPLWQFVSTNYEQVAEFPRPPDDTLYSIGDVGVWRRKR